MRGDRKYVYWRKYGSSWRAYFGRVGLIITDLSPGRFTLNFPNYNFSDFPSLNLAKRAGSRWLREQAGERAQKAKPGGGRPI